MANKRLEQIIACHRRVGGFISSDFSEVHIRTTYNQGIATCKINEENKSPETSLKENLSKIKLIKDHPAKIFVIMPFADEWDDVYHLGILATAKELNCSCERVDQIEYNGIIMKQIYTSIDNAQVIVAEVTEPNPNVYYELGYSHALKKPTILLTKSIKSTPFDLKGYNHIIYKKIIDMKPKLKQRLRAILH